MKNIFLLIILIFFLTSNMATAKIVFSSKTPNRLSHAENMPANWGANIPDYVSRKTQDSLRNNPNKLITDETCINSFTGLFIVCTWRESFIFNGLTIVQRGAGSSIYKPDWNIVTLVTLTILLLTTFSLKKYRKLVKCC